MEGTETMVFQPESHTPTNIKLLIETFTKENNALLFGES